jgi:hypothetical protein
MAAVLSKHLLGKISSNILQIFGVWCSLLVLKKKKVSCKTEELDASCPFSYISEFFLHCAD